MAQRQYKFSPLALLVSFMMGLGIWMNATLESDEYSTVLDVPLSVRLPENRAIETDLPQTIQVRVRGAGWQLFTMQFSLFGWQLAPSARCQVAISDKLIKANEEALYLSKSILAQNLAFPLPIASYDVITDSLSLGIGYIDSKTVPIRLVQRLKTSDEYRIVGKPTLNPATVEITGNKKLLNEIDHWKTELLELGDLNSNLSQSVRISDSLATILQFSISSTRVDIEVQQEAELTIEQVPLAILSAPDRHNIVFRPSSVSVTLRGGIQDILSLQSDEIRAVVQYKDILNNQTGLIRPEIRIDAADRIDILRPQPDFVRFTKRIRI